MNIDINYIFVDLLKYKSTIYTINQKSGDIVDYQLLSIYKYNGGGPSHTMEAVDKEYQHRLQGYSTVVTQMYPTLDVNEYDQIERYPLFFVQTNAMISMVNGISRNSKQIKQLANSLPGIAEKSYRQKLLTQEIFYTNEIEGVKTTKQEIGTVVGDLNLKKAPQRRLTSTVRLYNTTISGQSFQIHELADFRTIYDQLLQGEIPKNKLPDGKLFRNQQVFIGNDLKKVHTPPQTETEIQEKLSALITFLNSDDILDLLKAIATHFMFENTHPFLDGNGRMGRYLLSTYLANKLDTYTGLSVSTAIHAEQNGYYNAFKEADDSQNRADVTLFILKMLGIISQEQGEVIRNLTQLTNALDQVFKQIQSLKLTTLDSTILYLFSQSKLFAEDVSMGIKDTEMTDFLFRDDPKKFHKKDIRDAIQRLEQNDFLEKIKSRPLQHVISSKLLKQS